MSLSDTRARTTRCCNGPSQKITHLQYTTVSGGSLSRQIDANDGAKASTMSTDVLPKRTWMRARLRAAYTRNGSNPMLLPVRRRSRAIARRLQLLNSSSCTSSRACSTFDGASHLRRCLRDRSNCRHLACGLHLDSACLPRTPFCGTGLRSAGRPLCDELPASGDYLCENALRGRTSRRGQRRRKSTSAVRVGKVRA